MNGSGGNETVARTSSFASDWSAGMVRGEWRRRGVDSVGQMVTGKHTSQN